MERREFLKGLAFAGGGVALVGANCAKNLYARDQLRRQLQGEAVPILAKKSLKELQTAPQLGREEIETWFHEPCLNAAIFAEVVTSESFLDQLYHCLPELREGLFLSAFLTHVTTESTICQRVDLIAKEVGLELDLNWENCCGELSNLWDVHIGKFGTALPTHLSDQLEPVIRNGVAESLMLARAAGERPGLVSASLSLGKSAIMLLPLAKSPNVAVPLFVCMGVSHLFSYFFGMLNRKRSIHEIRQSVSARMSLLAQRIGAEFETEVRAGVGRLHQWQQHAIEVVVNEQAVRSVGLM